MDRAAEQGCKICGLILAHFTLSGAAKRPPERINFQIQKVGNEVLSWLFYWTKEAIERHPPDAEIIFSHIEDGT